MEVPLPFPLHLPYLHFMLPLPLHHLQLPLFLVVALLLTLFQSLLLHFLLLERSHQLFGN